MAFELQQHASIQQMLVHITQPITALAAPVVTTSNMICWMTSTHLNSFLDKRFTVLCVPNVTGTAGHCQALGGEQLYCLINICLSPVRGTNRYVTTMHGS